MKNLLKVSTSLLLVIFLVSCGRREEIRNAYKNSAEDNAKAEQESSVMTDMINSVAREGGQKTDSLGSNLPSCATATLDTTVTPRKLIINFGTSNCLCSNWDGKYRRGKIVATWSGKYRDAGTVITHSTEDYYVNDNKVIWNHSVTNNGPNGSGNTTFTVKAENCSIATSSGTVSWNSTRTREWISGYNTFNPFDDIYLITGKADGKNRDGEDFTIEIKNALRKEMSCRHIVSGSLTMTAMGKDDRELDYGSGACDDKATLKIRNKTYDITLR
jgi:hypothetical protein